MRREMIRYVVPIVCYNLLSIVGTVVLIFFILMWNEADQDSKTDLALNALFHYKNWPNL